MKIELPVNGHADSEFEDVYRLYWIVLKFFYQVFMLKLGLSKVKYHMDLYYEIRMDN